MGRTIHFSSFVFAVYVSAFLKCFFYRSPCACSGRAGPKNAPSKAGEQTRRKLKCQRRNTPIPSPHSSGGVVAWAGQVQLQLLHEAVQSLLLGRGRCGRRGVTRGQMGPQPSNQGSAHTQPALGPTNSPKRRGALLDRSSSACAEHRLPGGGLHFAHENGPRPSN